MGSTVRISVQLPTETMKQVVDLLSSAQRTNLMCACHRFFDIVARTRYAHIILRGHKSLNCLATIGRGTARSDKYTACVLSIDFKGDNYTEYDLVIFPVLCKALQRTRYLHILRVNLTFRSLIMLDHLVNRYRLVRTPHEPITVYARGFRTQIQSSPWLLPRLWTLSLGRGPAMLLIISFRMIITLWIMQPLGYTELESVFASITNMQSVPALERLGLGIEKEIPIRQVIVCIAHARPSIILLAICQKGISIRVRIVPFHKRPLLTMCKSLLLAFTDPCTRLPSLIQLIVNF